MDHGNAHLSRIPPGEHYQNVICASAFCQNQKAMLPSVSSENDSGATLKKRQGGLNMGKTLNILVITLIAAAGLQIAAVNVLYRSANYMELLKNVDLTALQSALSLMPFFF